MKILVTGGTGFTGSHIVEKLLKEGHQVYTFDRMHQNAEEVKKAGAHLIDGDIRNRVKVFEAVKGKDVIFHIAAAWQEYGKNYAHYKKVNVKGTKNVLDAAVHFGVKRFVHCSTVGVLGDVKEIPATEKTPLNPGDDYQLSKLRGEQLAMKYYKKHGLPVVVIRPVGIYGPRDRRLFKLFKLINDKKFIMLGSGNKLYHLTYIDDLVDGFLLAMKKKKAVGNVYIISGPEVKPINQIVGDIAKILKVDPPKFRLPVTPVLWGSFVIEQLSIAFGLKPFIVPRRLDFFRKNRSFSSEKAKKDLGYKPKVRMEEGFKKTISWYKKKKVL